MCHSVKGVPLLLITTQRDTTTFHTFFQQVIFHSTVCTERICFSVEFFWAVTTARTLDDTANTKIRMVKIPLLLRKLVSKIATVFVCVCVQRGQNVEGTKKSLQGLFSAYFESESADLIVCIVCSLLHASMG